MKYFEKITACYIQLDFPKKWGNPFRIIDEVEAKSLHDCIWERWANDVAEAMKPNGKSPFYGLGLASIQDKTNGFDTHGVCFLLDTWDDINQFNKTIEWAEKRLHIAYQELNLDKI